MHEKVLLSSPKDTYMYRISSIGTAFTFPWLSEKKYFLNISPGSKLNFKFRKKILYKLLHLFFRDRKFVHEIFVIIKASIKFTVLYLA